MDWTYRRPVYPFIFRVGCDNRIHLTAEHMEVGFQIVVDHSIPDDIIGWKIEVTYLQDVATYIFHPISCIENEMRDVHPFLWPVFIPRQHISMEQFDWNISRNIDVDGIICTTVRKNK